MITEQTITIPADGRVTFTAPEEWKGRTARILLFPQPPAPACAPAEEEPYPWRKWIGITKGSRWSSESLARDRARDNLIEEAQMAAQFHRAIPPEVIARAAAQGITLEGLRAEGRL